MIYTLMASTVKISETSEQKTTQKEQRKTDVLIPKAEWALFQVFNWVYF